jgi:two-component system sensor histidine kinase PilS (NtrC family)
MGNPKATTRTELASILLIRLGFLWLLVLLSFLIPKDDMAFYAIMGVAFTITIPYSLWLRSKLRSSQFAPLQFLVDLVLVTGLVYYTGGAQSELTLLYPLVILSAGIVVTPKVAAQITALGVLMYVLLVTLLSQGVLVDCLPAGITTQTEFSYFAIFMRVLLFTLFGAASIYVAKRCDYITTHEQDLHNTTCDLLWNNPHPILLLDVTGQILRANQPACELFNKSALELTDFKFNELCSAGPAPIPDSYGPCTYLVRDGESPVPVSYRVADLRLLETALHGSEGRKNEVLDVTIIAFSDISHPVKIENQLEQVERITAATELAGEMAHEIRTPLTSLSASVQLLKHYEERATSADWLPNSPRRRDREELFNHIEDASRQLDSVIQNFLDFAEFSPEDLLSIIKLDSVDENQGYIGHLNTVGRGFTNGQDSDCGRRSHNSQLVE